MQPEAWERLDAVFFHVLELPAGERAAYLDSVCGEDVAFRQEVEAVLAGHVAAGGTRDADRLLTPPAAGSGGDMAAGTRIGAYQLEALVGRGGMGEVYRARRADAQYEQKVAVKLMRAGRDTEELLQRFRTERQILARLQHPGIATLLDGGVTEAGQPYLVMQFVEGAPITTHANDHGLDRAARLRLFLKVCEPVQFAHTNLVVHRDLKPGNILVTGTGEVRLLDFGIAKLLDLETWGGSTTGDLLLLTPEHAAPEQFLGGPVTTATDVYALGVLLYELLTGARPFQFVSPTELHRAVCEEDPRPPSIAASEDSSAARTSVGPSPVAADQIAGDLDAIVLKALRKEPARRYASVTELADDVRRHLNGFPVQARPETLRYVVSRYVRRHRAGVLAGVALAFALMALVVVSVRFAVTTRAQARAIGRERDVAIEVSTFLENLFKAPDPFAVGPARRDTLRIRDFLAEGAAKVRQELGGRPLVQARLLTVLGRAQTELGQLDAARQLLEEAAAIRRRELGPGPETATTEQSLAVVLLELGQAARAESLFRSAGEALMQDSLRARREWVLALAGLGNSLQTQGRYPESEQAYRRALAVAEAGSGDSSPDLSGRLSDLANALTKQAKFAEAESLLRRSLALERSALGNDHPRVAIRLRNLALLLTNRGELEEAERLNREALAIYRARLPAGHPRTAATISNLAAVLARRGKFAEAEPLMREALAMQRALFGEHHIAVGRALVNLAALVDDEGRKSEALQLKREALDVLVASVGPEHPDVAVAHNNLAGSLHGMGRYAAALQEYEAALAIRRRKLGPTHPLVVHALIRTGQCLLDLGRPHEAEPRLQEAYAALEPRRQEEGELWDDVLGQMVRLYRVTGRPAEASRYEGMRPAPGDSGRAPNGSG
jgi:eukaryotic-like serine/threonine-protein kinase